MRKFLITLAIGMGLLPMLSMTPAYAHHPILSGESSCRDDGTQIIDWTAANSESVTGTNRYMTIDQVSIDRGIAPFSVGQTFPPTPLPDSSQDGTSTYGGAEAGSVILSVRVDFDGEGPQDVLRTATIVLVGGCVPVTTTTTTLIPVVVIPTLPEPTTTTTLPVLPTTTTAIDHSTTTTQAVIVTPTTLKPAVLGTNEIKTLPKTGSTVNVLLITAGILLLVGVGMHFFCGKKHEA